MQRYSWEHGVASQAFLEMGWDELVVLSAEAAVLRQDKEGRLAVMEPGEAITDPASNGEPLLRAAEITGKVYFREAAERNLEYLMKKAPRNSDGIIYHWPGKKIVMVDSYYMAPPFLAACGEYGEAVKQVLGYRDLLWNDDKKLFYHMWNDETMDYERKVFWGVGNGWAAAGIYRVISKLPAEMEAEKKQLAGLVNDLIDGCLAHQRDDGRFHDTLDDPKSFVDTNSAQEIAYTICRGIQDGWLGREYLAAADRMRAAAHRQVDQYGIIREVCAAPTFDYQGIAPEAQAFFLLMEAAFRDLEASK